MTIYYSCDSHVVEPAEVFEGLEKQFGSRAPHIRTNEQGDKTHIVFGDTPISVGRFGIAGHRLDDPATHDLIARGYSGMNAGAFDPAARLLEQEQDGIVGEVMYPSINMFTFSYDDRELAHAIFRRHNDWIRDYCSEAPERLVPVACIPMPDVHEAVEEVRRVAEMGLRGIAIPCTDPADKPYHHPDYEPFWTAVEETNLPVTMHFLTGSSWDMGLPAHWGSPGQSIMGYTMAYSALAVTLGHLLYGGVAEHHPGLKFVSAEFDTGWIGHFLWRLDHAYYRTPKEADPDLTMKPSDYFHRQFSVTFEDDEMGLRQRDVIGVDNMLWGNDYPHHDSIWPHSGDVLNRMFRGVSDEDKAKITSENVLKLYNIDRTQLPGGIDMRAVVA